MRWFNFTRCKNNLSDSAKRAMLYAKSKQDASLLRDAKEYWFTLIGPEGSIRKQAMTRKRAHDLNEANIEYGIDLRWTRVTE